MARAGITRGDQSQVTRRVAPRLRGPISPAVYADCANRVPRGASDPRAGTYADAGPGVQWPLYTLPGWKQYHRYGSPQEVAIDDHFLCLGLWARRPGSQLCCC